MHNVFNFSKPCSLKGQCNIKPMSVYDLENSYVKRIHKVIRPFFELVHKVILKQDKSPMLFLLMLERAHTHKYEQIVPARINLQVSLLVLK